MKSCCIKDYCGAPFDSTAQEPVPEGMEPRPFGQYYCPAHRFVPTGTYPVIVGKSEESE